MRLTFVVCKQSMRWLLKKQWKGRGNMKIPRLLIPTALKEKGIEIKDPVKEYMKPLHQQGERWTPPVADDPRYMAEPRPEDDPDWHPEHVYEVNNDTSLLEGLKQALNLTKCQHMNEPLPERVRDLVGQVALPHQDELVQRYIMQANRWDPTKEKLPKRKAPDLPIWNFKAELGIPQHKLSTILVRNLLRLCGTLDGVHHDLLTSRRVLRDNHMATFYYFKGDKHIQIQSDSDWLITSDRPLVAFADETAVDESVSHNLPDIYPIAPTIDITKQHIWRSESALGLREGSPFTHPHTIFLNNDNDWSTDRRNARALLHCFGHCIAAAKHRYGWDSETLPEPITVQCVHTDGINFNFIFFQLNTLNYHSLDGIKNLAWLDSDNYMYQKLIPKRSMLRNTKYRDYDPEVFKKILAVYLNGAKLGQKELGQGQENTIQGSSAESIQV